MSTVWRARDARLQRTVAIKLLSDTLCADASAVTSFAREARTHARIQHPNLVRVYDYGVTAPQPYLVMEYIDGDTLSARSDRGGFSAAAIQKLAREMLSALGCVHDHGVLHRDIKPANVLLDAEGRARLTDFGLARLEESSGDTRPDEVVGTLRFLAPELVEGEPASRQSDLFALGVLLRTVIGERRPLPEVEELISWLTLPSQNERPPDAHTALTQIGRRTVIEGRPIRPRRGVPRQGSGTASHAPHTGRRPASAGSSRHRSAGHIRSRVIAVSALVTAAAGAAFVAVGTGGGVPHVAAPPARSAKVSRPAAATAYSTRSATVDQQLQGLADSVRRAARL
jgi:serine/threonine protein kinase